MKTSKLLSLVLGIALLSSTAFAGNPKTELEKSVKDSSEELYVNPLEELLAMEAIPKIILDNNDANLLWATTDFENSEEDYTNPLEEVLAMETIPTITIKTVTELNNYNFETMEFDSVNPLEEVLEMEAIPTINLSVNSTLIVKN